MKGDEICRTCSSANGEVRNACKIFVEKPEGQLLLHIYEADSLPCIYFM
jgi:hypothetical protein